MSTAKLGILQASATSDVHLFTPQHVMTWHLRPAAQAASDEQLFSELQLSPSGVQKLTPSVPRTHRQYWLLPRPVPGHGLCLVMPPHTPGSAQPYATVTTLVSVAGASVVVDAAVMPKQLHAATKAAVL